MRKDQEGPKVSEKSLRRNLAWQKHLDAHMDLAARTHDVDDSGHGEVGVGKWSLLAEFCHRTSLHGWNFCLRAEKPILHTIAWLGVIVASSISAGFLLFVNIKERDIKEWVLDKLRVVQLSRVRALLSR